MKNILILPGDGIGPEIVAEAVKVLDRLKTDGLAVELEQGLVGGTTPKVTRYQKTPWYRPVKRMLFCSVPLADHSMNRWSVHCDRNKACSGCVRN